MALSFTSIAQLSSDLVDARFPEVCVDGVLSGAGDSDRVEVILTVSGSEPHRLMFNLTRVDSDAFERELDAKLGYALADLHR
jgi:hypothetical protein